MPIGLTVRVLCANVHFIAIKLRNVPPMGKNVKKPQAGLRTYTNTTLGSKVKGRNLRNIDRTHGLIVMHKRAFHNSEA